MKLALLLAACTSTAQPLSNHGGGPPTAEARLAQVLTARGLNVTCLSIDQAGEYFEVRELHERPCPGNPDTVPVIGWFRVHGELVEEFDRSSETWTPTGTSPGR
jgi:hypothetical protein